MTDYYCFRVRVTSEGSGKYTTEVTFEPQGLFSRSPAFPDPFQITGLRSKLATRPSESGLRQLGTLLFESLFDQNLAAIFANAQTLAQEKGSILHIQLALQPNELSALPWELLCDPRTGQFLALSEGITFARYVPLPTPAEPLRIVGQPLRVLALFPNPRDLPPIDLDHEIQIMEGTLAPLIQTGRVELVVLRHATVHRMLEALRDRPVHILYYQGHVGYNSYERKSFFLLEDPAGEQFIKGMEELRWSLDRYDVRLVVINSCGMSAGTLAYSLVNLGIPAVVATQEPINDEETASYLKGFFSALADGLAVDRAMQQGRLAIARMSNQNGRWASPLLVTRQNTVMFTDGSQP